MIKERYCSYKISKLLQESGFDEPCSKAYMNDSMVTKSSAQLIDFNSKGYVSKPTHQMAMDWLRKKGYHIEIYANASGYKFIISKTPPDGTDLVCNIEGNNDGGAWDDYGECAESAIEYCLTELVKGGKQ